MTPEIMSIVLFLIFCMGARVGITYLTATYLEYLPLFGLLALLPAFGFMYFYLSGTRKTGPEVFGRPIWWNDLRPVHAALYITFAINALQGNKDSWMFLAADVGIGLVAFLNHHFL
jgi:hypothetical protein